MRSGFTKKIKITKVEHIKLKKEIVQTPKAFLIENRLKVMNVKQYITLRQAAFMLKLLSPLTLRRWTLCGKMPANKIGKKWVYKRKEIDA